MTRTDTHEQKFFKALNDIFVGAKIEGESGYINLMRIKSRYYTEGVFPHLKKDIDQAIAEYPEFREELFDKLYTFFQRYFSESGSIYFRHTALHQNIYEKVYTDDRDVVLFWKTHMLYYVKTDRLFKSMLVEVEGQKFWFDASQVELKRANEKRDVIFTFRERRTDDTLVFDVTYSERGSKSREEEILKALKKEGVGLCDELLNQAFRVFEKQSEVDFFINKDARSFLREQFDLWMYQYLFEGQNVWSAERLAQLQSLKGIAYKVIDFISQFEDELVKVWNKPKFVRNSHYVITLDKLQGTQVLEKILSHSNFNQQVQEWRDLGMLDDNFSPDMLKAKNLIGESLHSRYQYLPIDTKHFSDLELGILSLFDHLDKDLDGWLVHSENYQSLRTLLSKYRARIRSIYIDPPYNSKSTEILYINTYKHSTWLTMMENRLQVSKEFCISDGSHVIAIDENEQESLGSLLSKIFPDHARVCTSIIHNKKGIQGDYFSYNHDFAYYCLPPSLGEINGHPIPKEEWEYVSLRKWGTESTRDTAKNCFYPIYVKEDVIIGFGDVCSDSYHPISANLKRNDGVIEVYPIDNSTVERKWRYARNSVESILSLLKVAETKDGEKQIIKARNFRQFKTVWDNPLYIAGDYGTRLLTDMGIKPKNNLYPKSVYAIADAILATTLNSSIVLDYFAGSGTTAHAVMNLNRGDGGKRKYILVEMGDHFNTVILPRVKKVAFNSKWKDGKPVFSKEESGISHFVKYYELEQYEEVLQKARYADSDLFEDPNQDPYHNYVFKPDLKLLHSLEIAPDAEKVYFHSELLYPDIDLAETLSHLRGKWIKHITKEFVEFEDGEQMSLIDPDWQTLKPMIWWQ
jgi:adenine-specific DNA-methyltransferase